MDVTSFGIDHHLLLRGIYVSQVDEVGNDYLTTFDIRLREPNREPVIDTAALHTMEHMLAYFFRTNQSWADKTIYIGPMGCRTGFYFIFKGNLKPEDILPVLTESFEYIINYNGEIPAAQASMCGNYLDNNLDMAKWECKRFLEEVIKKIKPENLVYPRRNQ